MSWNSEVRLSRISKGPWKKSQVLMVQESICSISCTLQIEKTYAAPYSGPWAMTLMQGLSAFCCAHAAASCWQ